MSLPGVTMALRSALRVPKQTMKEADKTFHAGAGGGEEEPLRQECAWIGRGSFSNGGEKKKPRMSNLSCTLEDVTGQTVAFLQGSHREREGVG